MHRPTIGCPSLPTFKLRAFPGSRRHPSPLHSSAARYLYILVSNYCFPACQAWILHCQPFVYLSCPLSTSFLRLISRHSACFMCSAANPFISCGLVVHMYCETLYPDYLRNLQRYDPRLIGMNIRILWSEMGLVGAYAWLIDLAAWLNDGRYVQSGPLFGHMLIDFIFEAFFWLGVCRKWQWKKSNPQAYYLHKGFHSKKTLEEYAGIMISLVTDLRPSSVSGVIMRAPSKPLNRQTFRPIYLADFCHSYLFDQYFAKALVSCGRMVGMIDEHTLPVA